MKNNNIIFVIFFIFIFLFISCNNNDNNSRKNTKENKNEKTIDETIVDIKSIEDAKKYAVGTWQFTEKSDVWDKYVIKMDGTFEMYMAEPRSGKWGNTPSIGTWDVGTDRYSDTGRKLFYIEVKFKNKYKSSWKLAFLNSNKIMDPKYRELIRTDKNPWD